jgi:hypothetical protein
MNQLLLVSLALLFYASLAQAQEPPSPPAAQVGPDTASKELVTLKAWTDAMNAKDREELEALVSPEFVCRPYLRP